MPRYEAPDSTRYENYMSKFIRVGDELYMTPRGESWHYGQLAKSDNIEDKIKELRKADLAELDAGTFLVTTGHIFLSNRSSELNLPVDKAARIKTLEVFSHLSPNFEISSDLGSNLDKK